MFGISETARLNRIILEGGYNGLTEEQFFAAEIREWKQSKRRQEQIQGAAYYMGHHDILKRRRTIIGQDGKIQEVDNLPNNRIVDNQLALMVDQKTNYLLGKPLTITSPNPDYTAALHEYFNRSFFRLLKYLGEDALNGGLGWLYLYYNSDGKLSFKHFPAHEILPFWADDDHTVLDCALRLYPQEVWNGYSKEIVERVEIYKKDGLYRYVFDGYSLIPDVELGEHEDYLSLSLGDDQEVGLNWERIPLIAFKGNKQELPLISRVKSLQDALNQMLSDFQNNMQEDARNTILILRNYDGEDLGEFRRNLATYGAVKVRDDGGVSTLSVEVNSNNYNALLKLLKDKLIENARGYNAKDDRLGNNPNQMNIQSMYSDLDLDANGMELEFQAALEELLWFLDQDLANSGKGEFSEQVTFVFNRDVLLNEAEAIANCGKSSGIISQETIIANHPWVSDVELERDRLRRERRGELESDDYSEAFRR